MAYKKTNITNVVVIGVIAIIGLAFVFATVSQNSGTGNKNDARARAGLPEPCTKEGTQGIISNLQGVVVSKDEAANTFVVDIGARNEKRNRVVYNCDTLTAWQRAKGRGSEPTDLVKMIFADLNVGDTIVIDGNYIDKNKQTIYPKLIKDMSLHPELIRGDVSAASATELTIGANKVNITSTTRCYNGIRLRAITKQTEKIACTFAVGDKILANGIYSDAKNTLLGPYAQIVKNPKD